MTYDVLKEPKGKDYHTLIDMACARSDAIMLIYQNYHEYKKMSAMRDQLKPYCLISRETKRWPVTQTWDTRNTYTMELYAITDEVNAFLHKLNRLYAWLPPPYPMDIAFFRNGVCWFASSAHEGFAWVIWEDESSIDLPLLLDEVPDDPLLIYKEDYLEKLKNFRPAL